MKTKKILSLCLVLVMLFSFMTIAIESTSAAETVGKVNGLTVKEKASGKLQFKWKKVDGASGYKIVYASDTKFKENVKKVTINNGDTVKFTTPKKISGSCFVKVRAFKKSKGKTVAGAFSDKTATFVITDKYFGDEKDAKITLWVPDALVSLAKDQCKAFTKKYSDRNITVKVKPQGEDTAATMMLSDPEASADVFSFVSDQLSRLNNAYVIAPIAPTIADVVKTTDYKQAVKVCTIDGNLFAIPETGNGYYLVYDKRVVSAKQAKSLEKVLKACKKSDKKFVMDMGTGYYSCSVVFAGGLKLNGFKADGYTQKFTDYDEETVVATLKAFSKLTHKYSGTFTSLGPENISSGFANGAVGAGVDGSWNSSVDKEALGKNLGATKLPTITVNGKKRQLLAMYGYKMFGVNATSQYPRTSQLLAYYLSTANSQKQRVNELGWNPTNKAVGASKAVKKDVILNAMTQQMKNSVAQVEVADTFWDPMANLGMKLVSKNTNPDTYNFKKLLNNTIDNITDDSWW